MPGLAAFGKSFLYLFPTWQLSLLLGHLPLWYCQEGIWPCPALFVSKANFMVVWLHSANLGKVLFLFFGFFFVLFCFFTLKLNKFC